MILMARDFEQLIYDTRHWLLGARPRPTVRNEVANFGVVRRAKTIITDPMEIVAAVESVSMLNPNKRIGALMLTATADSANDSAILHWNTEGTVAVLSPLTRIPNKYVPLSIMTGPVLDRVYERFAPAMDQVLQTLR